MPNGENLIETQTRNIAALNDVLVRHNGKNIVIGTHGTALSTIINYYDNTYGFSNFMAMLGKTPWIVKMEFDGNDFVAMEMIDLC
jgi:2,3-bisphosphoglycerate-dependent phosphoglycerate mutase